MARVFPPYECLFLMFPRRSEGGKRGTIKLKRQALVGVVSRALVVVWEEENNVIYG